MTSSRSTNRRCDGVRRRDFLHLGMIAGLGLTAAGGLSLADLFRLRAAQAAAAGRAGPATRPAKAVSCILIWLDGGPSHLDTFDPKPDAAAEVRGEFKAIPTAVDGIRIAEHLPRIAKVMGDVALVRSLTHELGNHDTGSHYLLTGHRPTPAIEYPSYGSIVARECAAAAEKAGAAGEKAGAVEKAVAAANGATALPPYVAIPAAGSAGGPGYLPGAFAPFAVGGDPGRDDYRVRDLEPPAGVSFDRIGRRRQMLKAVDGFSRSIEAGPPTAGRDAFYEQAYRLMTSPQAKAAFELTKEPEAVRNRYGRSRVGAGCLLARRLVEAGARFVTVVDSGWDTHTQIFRELPDSRFPGSGKLPSLDQGYAALLTDLRERGLLDSTLVLLMGEFGRTPKINSSAGRDHWPRAGFACLAGGGVRGGQAIGATDASGEVPADLPVSPEDLGHSVLRLLGIDPRMEYMAPGGRPLKLLDGGEMIRGLV